MSDQQNQPTAADITPTEADRVLIDVDAQRKLREELIAMIAGCDSVLSEENAFTEEARESVRLHAENAELKRQLGDALVATHNTVATLRGELMQAQASPAEWRNGRNCMKDSRTLLEEWVSAHSWTREAWIGFMSGWRVELASNSTQLQFMLVVYDRPQLAQPIVNERYHEVYLGTSESPASLDDVILAALAKWEELHGS